MGSLRGNLSVARGRGPGTHVSDAFPARQRVLRGYIPCLRPSSCCRDLVLQLLPFPGFTDHSLLLKLPAREESTSSPLA